MFLEEKRELVQPLELEPWRKKLLDAADLIEEKGWCRQRFCDDDGRYCAVGAIDDDDLGNSEAIEKLAQSVGWKGPKGRIKWLAAACIIEWNDEPGRTAAQVIAHLRAVATLP